MNGWIERPPSVTTAEMVDTSNTPGRRSVPVMSPTGARATA